MNVIDLSVKRPVLTLVVLLAFVVFGILAYFSIPVSLFPDIKVPYVTIQTVYAGANPEDIETQITKKIEDQVTSISDLDTVTSYSMDSASIVIVQFKYGKDENLALQEVKDKVEVIIPDFPSGAKRPAISKIDISSMMPVMNIVLEGDMTPTELYTFADKVVVDQLSQVAGVSSVEIGGGQEREIRVELDRSTVYSRSVPLTQIAGILAAANMELPGGNVGIQNRDVPVRIKGSFESLDEIRNLDIPTKTGVYKVRQLGEVKDTTKTVRERTLLLDKKAGTRNDNALLLQVLKNPSANTISVVDEVMARLPAIEQNANGHINFKVVKEDASFVRSSVSDTLSNVGLGILFTGLVLLFFLHDWRSTLIVALAMPFSIIATFLIMKFMGISMNMLSLMGLSSSTGILVANSIVVLENIFRYKELGHDRTESAIKGTKEVVVAVFASTLTNIAVFLPLANMEGLMGSVLANFAYTIVIATVFSILVSYTLTPLMASRILPEKVTREGPISRGLEAMFKRWEDSYGKSLAYILKNKRRSFIVVFISFAAFVISILGFLVIKFELIPNTDGGKIQISVELPQGTNLDTTTATLAQIEERIGSYKEVESILTSVGSLGLLDKDVSMGQMNIYLVPKEKRSKSNSELSGEFIKLLSDIPADIKVKPLSEIAMGGGIGGSMIDLYLRGDDNAVLFDLANQIKTRITKVPGVTNAGISSKGGKAEYVFIPNRKRISADGLSVQAIAMSLRAAVDGLVMTTYKEGGREYDIRVVLKDSSLQDLEDIKNIPIVATTTTRPLSYYADVQLSSGYNKIMRTNKTRTVEITTDLLPGYAQGQVLNDVLAAIKKDIQLPAGYSIQQAGASKMLSRVVSDMIMVFVIATLLTYMLLAAILESFTQPLFILATVPLALIGVVVSLLITGVALNFVAMLAIVMLVGIVVNNAILILDYYSQLRREGKNAHDAFLIAAPTKLKPIIMSNIAIVLGMLPMAMGIGASGAEMRTPMGIVTIGGIISSTIMTLYLIPALEYLLTRLKRKMAKVAATAKES